VNVAVRGAEPSHLGEVTRRRTGVSTLTSHVERLVVRGRSSTVGEGECNGPHDPRDVDGEELQRALLERRERPPLPRASGSPSSRARRVVTP
jgi:hypothetical protein